MADADKKRPPTRVVTGKVRLSYVYLARPEADDNGNENYRSQILIPTKDEKTLKAMKSAIQHATIKFAKGDKAKAAKYLKHPKFHKPIRNPKLEDLEGDQYKGMMFLSAKSKDQPTMLLKNGSRVEDENQITKHFYSGVWVNCSLSFYPFDQKGNKGVAVGLNSLIKHSDDDRLDGRADAMDELGEFIDEDATEMLGEDDDDLFGETDEAPEDEDEDDFDLDL